MGPAEPGRGIPRPVGDGLPDLAEILQALPGADNALLSLEDASDGELRASGDTHRGIRQAALDKQSGQEQPEQ
jgi:hypothetical protein